MDVRILTRKDRAALDAFVATHPDGGVEQSWAFGEFQVSVPGRSHFYVFGLFDGVLLKGSMLVVRQTMGFGKSWLWCPGGPLLPASGTGWNLMQKAAAELAKDHGDVFLRIEPIGELASGGVATKSSYLPRNTLVLNLAVSEDDLLKQMTQKGRYNIKQAEKHGIVVTEAKAEELPDFYKLLKETAARDGFFVHAFAFYENFIAKLGGKAHLLLAKQNGVTVAGALLTYFGSTARYYFGASTMAFGDNKAPYLLQWTAVRAAKQAGIKVYDFFGIAPDGDAKHALSGVTQFKTRFGGKRVSYPKSRVFVYRPLWWWLYSFAKRLKP